LTSLEPHFATIQSATFVYKHLYATKPHYDLGSPMSLKGFLSNRLQITTEWTDASATGERVKVRKRDRSETYLIDALKPVVEEMWPRFLPPESDDQ
jgi:hypothetical protein